MKIFLTFLIFLFASQSAHAKKDVNVHVVPFATLNSSRFQLNQTSTASFSGLSYGGYVSTKFNSNRNYGVALLGGFEAISLDNTANTSTEYETLEGSVINIGARFYAVDLFLGMGILYINTTDTYVGTTSLKTNYTGLGVRLETGMDLHLGKTVMFIPRIHYDISDFSPESATSTKQRFKNFGASAGLGLEF